MLPTIMIGTIPIGMYHYMMGVGMVGMFVTVLRRREKNNLSVPQALKFTLLMIAVSLVGTFVMGYVSWNVIGAKDIFGAIFLLIPTMPFVGRLFGLTSGQAFDLTAMCMLVVHFFVRIGCYCAGCCEGIVIYTDDSYFQFPYIITMCLVNILMILWFLRIELRANKQGVLYPLFLISYGSMRIIWDALMYYENLMLGLRPAQWYGMIAVIIGFIWLIRYKKRIKET